MLAKQKPYVAENPMAIIYMHRNAPMPKLPEPLAVLQPLIEKLMAKKPADRLASAMEAVEAIREAARELKATELAA